MAAIGCGGGEPPTPPAAVYAAFSDRAAGAGLGWLGPSASGCGILDDLDRDGLDDAAWTYREPRDNTVRFLVSWGSAPGSFEPPSGFPVPGFTGFLGCASADFDRSGLPDVVLSGFGELALLRQTAPRSFVIEEIPVDQPAGGAMAALAVLDVDLDGWPDLLGGQAPEGGLPGGSIRCFYYVDEMDLRCAPPPGLAPPPPPVLLLNESGALVPAPDRVTTLPKEPHFTAFTVATADFDGDFRTDAVIGVDFGEIQYFHGTADGRLEERHVSGTERYAHVMGSAIGDVNGDGRPDLLTSDVGPCMLLLSERGGGFRSVERETGVAEGTREAISWGAGIFDADLDGDLDLWTSNRHNFTSFGELLAAAAGVVWVSGDSLEGEYDPGLEAPENDFLLVNDGMRFSRQLLPDWPAVVPPCIPIVAFSDVDRDGDVDALQVLCDEVRLLINESPAGGAWLELALRGTASTLEAFGARVVVSTPSRARTAYASGGAGFASVSSRVLHFGLGRERGPVRVEVRWPSGCTSTVDAQPVDVRVTLTEPESCP